MRKVVRSVLVYVVLGALLTYATAGICALGYYLLWGPYEQRVLGEDPGETLTSRLMAQMESERHTGWSQQLERVGVGVTEVVQVRNRRLIMDGPGEGKQTPKILQLRVVAGIPLGALECTARATIDPTKPAIPTHTGGIFLSESVGTTRASLVVPLAPIWTTFAANLAFWTGFLFASVAAGKRWRADRRARRGACPHCGHLRAASVCSECGHPTAVELIDYRGAVMRALPYLQWVLAVAASWLGMQAIHELGHVLAALPTGALINAVHLHPLEFSRTDTTMGLSPLAVVWSGPIFGVAAPCVMFAIASWLAWPSAFLFRLFAAFCLLANGAYIGIGAWDNIGDAGDMLRMACPVWVLVAFGLVAILASARLFSGLAAQFGFGRQGQPVRTANLVGLALVFTLLFVTGWWLLP